MNDTNERSVASAGSVEPVAWAVVYPNDEVAVIAFKRGDADERAAASDCVVPLYRHPSPALTDAEREAVTFAYKRMLSSYVEEREIALAMSGLLERLGGGE